jgi:hypothetical protein
MLVNLGILRDDRFECGTADETQLAIPQRRNRSRPRAPIDHGHVADKRTRPQYGKDALGAGGRDHADFEQALIQAVAAVTRIAGKKEDLVGRQLDRLGIGEKAGRQPLRQVRQQIDAAAKLNATEKPSDTARNAHDAPGLFSRNSVEKLSGRPRLPGGAWLVTPRLARSARTAAAALASGYRCDNCKLVVLLFAGSGELDGDPRRPAYGWHLVLRKGVEESLAVIVVTPPHASDFPNRVLPEQMRRQRLPVSALVCISSDIDVQRRRCR